MKKITFLLFIVALLSGTAMTYAQDYTDLNPDMKGAISGQVLVYNNPNLVFNPAAATGSRLGTYTLAANGVDFQKKAVVEFDYYTTSAYGGGGPFVLSFKDANNTAIFALYTNNASSSTSATTMGIAAGPLDTNGQTADLSDAQKMNLPNLTIPGGNVNGLWLHIKATVDLVRNNVTFDVKNIGGTDYSDTETLPLPTGYTMSTGIRTIVFNSIRASGSIYGVFELTNLGISNLDATVPDEPENNVSIALTSGQNNQAVGLGNAITDIVYTWSGDANAANVVWTPAGTPNGITVTPDATAKTVTISGAPAAGGTYRYSITSTDGTIESTPLTGAITAIPNTAGGGLPKEITTFVPSDSHYYRIICYGSSVNSSANTSGAAKYLTITATPGTAVPESNGASVLTTTTAFNANDRNIVWDITPYPGKDGYFSIKNLGTNSYFSSAGGIADAVVESSTADDFAIPNATTGPTISGNDYSYFRICRESGPKQIRPNTYDGRWYWDQGTNDRADMVFTIVPVNKSEFPEAASTLALTLGSNTQTITVGDAIADIVYTWGGSATEANVTWTSATPAGITVTPDAIAKTVIISGTPEDAGVYEYSITATDGTTESTPLTGTITVKEPEGPSNVITALYEPFDTVVAPWGFSLGGGTVATIETIANPYGKVLQFAQSASQSGTRISAKTDINWAPKTEGTDGLLYLEFDWYSGSPTSGTGGFIRFIGSNDTIFTIGIQGASDNILFGNLVPRSQTDISAAGISITPSEGSFVRNDWYHVYASLDFSSKKIVEFKMTNSAGNTYEASNVNFINPTATAITRMEVINGRTAGANGNWPLTQIDNMHIYYLIPDVLTYDAFMDFVAKVQAAHDAETSDTAFMTAIKGTLQTAINAAKGSVNESSSETELNDAKATLQAALDAFNAAKLHFTALQTSITSVTASYTTAAARVGTKFLNYSQTALDALNAAIATANNALASITTADELDAANTAVENALTTFTTTGRVDPLTTPYKIYSYGIAGATGDGDKRFLYNDGTNTFQKLVSAATGDENDLWIITKGTTGYIIQNTVSGKYLARTGDNQSQTDDPTEVTFVDGSTSSNAISIDEGFFLYGIISGGSKALELDTDPNLWWKNAFSDQRSRFDFQFEEVTPPAPPAPFVIGATETKTKDDYLAGNYSDIIFQSNDASTGQLTIPAGETLEVNGVVKLQKTFTTEQWYPVGFPFDVNTFYCDDFSGNTDEGLLNIYGSTEDGSSGFWVKDFDGKAFNDYTTGNGLSAGAGYIIKFPAAFDGHEITFISDADVVLTNTTAPAAALTADVYTLVANPSVADVSSIDGAKYYYMYDSTVNKFNLSLTAPKLKPFEAMIVLKDPTATPLPGISVEGEVGLKPVTADDQAIEIHYYNLLGVEIQKPAINEVYITKKIYKSGKIEVVKAYDKK